MNAPIVSIKQFSEIETSVHLASLMLCSLKMVQVVTKKRVDNDVHRQKNNINKPRAEKKGAGDCFKTLDIHSDDA